MKRGPAYAVHRETKIDQLVRESAGSKWIHGASLLLPASSLLPEAQPGFLPPSWRRRLPKSSKNENGVCRDQKHARGLYALAPVRTRNLSLRPGVATLIPLDPNDLRTLTPRPIKSPSRRCRIHHTPEPWSRRRPPSRHRKIEVTEPFSRRCLPSTCGPESRTAFHSFFLRKPTKRVPHVALAISPVMQRYGHYLIYPQMATTSTFYSKYAIHRTLYLGTAVQSGGGCAVTRRVPCVGLCWRFPRLRLRLSRYSFRAWVCGGPKTIFQRYAGSQARSSSPSYILVPASMAATRASQWPGAPYFRCGTRIARDTDVLLQRSAATTSTVNSVSGVADDKALHVIPRRRKPECHL